MYLTKSPDRAEILGHFETCFKLIQSFRESWQGRFSRSIFGSYKDLERNIEAETDGIYYLIDHPAATLSDDDIALFDCLMMLIDEDMKRLENGRIKPARTILQKPAGPRLFF